MCLLSDGSLSELSSLNNNNKTSSNATTTTSVFRLVLSSVISDRIERDLSTAREAAIHKFLPSAAFQVCMQSFAQPGIFFSAKGGTTHSLRGAKASWTRLPSHFIFKKTGDNFLNIISAETGHY